MQPLALTEPEIADLVTFLTSPQISGVIALQSALFEVSRAQREHGTGFWAEATAAETTSVPTVRCRNDRQVAYSSSTTLRCEPRPHERTCVAGSPSILTNLSRSC
jgi:hypothetical protein